MGRTERIPITTPQSSGSPRPGGARLCAAVVYCAAIWAVLSASPSWADEILACGSPITANLANGAEDTYQISTSASATVVVDVIDVSGTIDALRLESEDQETCYGSLTESVNGSTELQVHDCIGTDSGTYAINMNVVSQGPDNCAEAMPCGSFPYVRRLLDVGQVDSYSFAGTTGDHVTVRATAINGAIGTARVRLFAPDGHPVDGGDSCNGVVSSTLQSSGTYTVLISACGLPKAGLYLLSFQSPACPNGPDITHLGIAKADGTPLPPDMFDDEGRPVYSREVGSGFLLIFEARVGASGATVGDLAYDYDPNDPTVLPDLQVVLSQPLGDGSPAVCDKTRPNIGGVPAVPSLSFDPVSQTVSNAINDFGCRIDNGAGQPEGVSSADACTSFPDGDFHFVEPTSTLQYCMLVSGGWQFQTGQTVVKARVRDQNGNVGAPREMVIDVNGVNPTPAPTATATPGHPYCSGDCNDDGQVTVNELIIGVNIALEAADVSSCEAFDLNHDGLVTVDEIIPAVTAALNGCPN